MYDICNRGFVRFFRLSPEMRRISDWIVTRCSELDCIYFFYFLSLIPFFKNASLNFDEIFKYFPESNNLKKKVLKKLYNFCRSIVVPNLAAKTNDNDDSRSLYSSSHCLSKLIYKRTHTLHIRYQCFDLQSSSPLSSMINEFKM